MYLFREFPILYAMSTLARRGQSLVHIKLISVSLNVFKHTAFRGFKSIPSFATWNYNFRFVRLGQIVF